MVTDTSNVPNLSDKRIDKLITTLRAADVAEDQTERLQFECAAQIRDLLASGWSTRMLAEELKDRGYVSPKTGKPMSRMTMIYYGKAAGHLGVHCWADAFALAKAGVTDDAEVEEIKAEATSTGKAVSTVTAKRRIQEGKLAVPRPDTQKARILDCVVTAAEREQGMSSAVIADHLHDPMMPTQRVATRTADLEKDGWIVPVYNQKLNAAVWFLSEEGARQLGLPKGWRPKRKRRTITRRPPKNETPNEKRRRQEREAIKAAEAEWAAKLGAAAQFREHGSYWRRWSGRFADLAELAEEEPCPPSTGEWLIIVLEGAVEEANRALMALKNNEPCDVTFYALLGVDGMATDAEIKTAYRDLARRYHPDTNPDPAAAEHFKEIAVAYNVLSDPDKRFRYNLYGKAMR